MVSALADRIGVPAKFITRGLGHFEEFDGRVLPEVLNGLEAASPLHLRCLLIGLNHPAERRKNRIESAAHEPVLRSLLGEGKVEFLGSMLHKGEFAKAATFIIPVSLSVCANDIVKFEYIVHD